MFCEKQWFIKSDSGTRLVRLSPLAQAFLTGSAGLFGVWSVCMTAVFMVDVFNVGSPSGDRALRTQALESRYEKRVEGLVGEHDAHERLIGAAGDRFDLALGQIRDVQARLFRSQAREHELQANIETLQRTLRETIVERDDARARVAYMSGELNVANGSTRGIEKSFDDMQTSMAFVTDALNTAVVGRDKAIKQVQAAQGRISDLETRIDAMTDRNIQIFARLEQAVERSIKPMRRVFESIGLPVDDILEQVRGGYENHGGVLASVPMPVKAGDAVSNVGVADFNRLVRGLRAMDMHRIAAERIPLDHPVRGTFRVSSGFGKRWGRMHAGLDFAGPRGTDIVAAADGVVVYANWEGAYGKVVKIRHDFGFETRYAHLSRMHVSVGQKVSRGDHIADMGRTGRSTGTHLHYEIRRNGRALDPQPFVKAGQNVF